MREIKFRFWNKEHSRMTLPENLFIDPYYESEYGALVNEWFKKNGIFMQFTGLLDKNGKEVWEGDIVKDAFGDIWEVDFKNARFRLPNPCEVIGNIYENPELLK